MAIMSLTIITRNRIGTTLLLILVVYIVITITLPTIPTKTVFRIHRYNNRTYESFLDHRLKKRQLRIVMGQHEGTSTHHYHRYFLHDNWYEQEQHQKHQDDSLQKINIQIPIVIQLSGELGNHLSKLAAGIGVAAMIHQYNYNHTSSSSTSDSYYFTTNLHIRHQDHTTKGDTSLRILQECFPNLIQIQNDVDETSVFITQHPILHTNDPHSNVNSNHVTEVDMTIQSIIQDAINAYESASNSPTEIIMPYQTPFIVYSNHLVGFFDVYMDRFYDLYRQYFIIDESNPTCGCTSQQYQASAENTNNNILFYYRGYQIELPKKGIPLGYEEIHPNSLVSYLLEQQQYQPNIYNVAIVSRFPDRTEPYVNALTNVGYTVRVIQHMNSTNIVTSVMHDFCYLRRLTTTIELIGPIRSTFFMWASILAIQPPNNTSRIRNNRETKLHPPRRTTITAYTTKSQLEWATKYDSSIHNTEQYNEHSAMDSITPIYYYNNNSSSITNDDVLSLWRERNFQFPIFT
jgi:hypothetical protein